ncbi:tripartite tricarboxylate transporter permease [Candidatus Woesearchaeota archaeon]|nr:tripartite tricarboxylate transporter permease [Candidatus Woesearchaeota archaeon]
MIEIIIGILVGICFGIFTGLSPGIHVNLISVLLFSISAYLLKIVDPLILCITIVSMAITHTFLDIIPSIFLGVPDEEEAIAALPSHRMLLQGNAFEAVQLSTIGALGGLVVAVILIPIFLLFTENLYAFLESSIALLLILTAGFMIMDEKNKIWALIIFLISGVLGIVTFAIPVNEPLFPLFSGLFGISMLVNSIKENVKIPEQKFQDVEIKGAGKAIFTSVIMGWVASFMPGIGTAQVAAISAKIVKLEEKAFIILVGGLSTVNMLLSLVSLYLLEKARNGAIVVVMKLLEVKQREFYVLVFSCLITGGIAAIITLKLAKSFTKLIEKIDYKKLCIGVLFVLLILVAVISGWMGVTILVISTSLGILVELKQITKSQMMGCLIIPVVIYFI